MQPGPERSLTEQLFAAFLLLETRDEQKSTVGILQEILTSTYPEKAAEIAAEIDSTIDTIHQKATSLRQGRSQGLSQASWFSSTLKAINEASSSPDSTFQGVEGHLTSLRLAEQVQRLSARFLSEPPEEEAQGASPEEAPKESKVAQSFLLSSPGSSIETDVSKVATSVAVASGLISKESTAIQGAAVTIDLGLTAVKAAYRVATGTISLGEAFEAVSDRSLAAVVALTEQACVTAGARLGAALGQAVATVFSPSAALVGGTVGRALGTLAGEVAGRVVASMIRTGFEKIAPLAREMFNKAKESLNSAARSVTEGIKEIMSRLFG